MKTTVSSDAFIEAFRGSKTYKDNFSYNGLCALFDYLEDYEEASGKEIELNIIELCLEFAEYPSLEEAQKEFCYDIPEGKDLKEFFEERGEVIEFDGGVIISKF